MGFIPNIIDWSFGYDFFISYAHADGLNYPLRLKEKLEQAGFKVFLDKSSYVAGDELRRMTHRRVRMSRKLAVIARPAAMVSEWVYREVGIHLSARKTPIIININHTIEKNKDKRKLASIVEDRDWLYIEENIKNQDEIPTDHCVSELIRAFDATRQETKRLRFFSSVAIVLIGLTILSVIGTYLAIQNKNIADQEREIAIARFLATSSDSAIQSKPELSLLLAIQSVQTTYRKNSIWLPSAEQALRKSVTLVGGEPLRLKKEKNEIIAKSPDGSHLAIADNAGKITLWNLNELYSKPKIFSAHDQPIKSVAYSPNCKWIATTVGDSKILVWNLSKLENGRPEYVMESNSGEISLITFSPDNRWISAKSKNTIYIWGLKKGSNDLTIPLPDNSFFSQAFNKWKTKICFSPDGNWISIIDTHLTGYLINIITQKAYFIMLGVHNPIYITKITFSPDNKSFAIGTARGAICIFRLENLVEKEENYSEITLSPRFEGAVLSLKFSPTENILAASGGGQNRIINIWNTDKPNLLPKSLHGHTDTIWSIVFSPNGKQLASGSQDHSIRLWNLESQNAQPVILRGHDDMVSDVLFSNDGNKLVSIGVDNVVRVWNLSNPTKEPLIVKTHKAPIRAVDFSPDTKFLATSSDDGTLRLWNREKMREEVCLYKSRGDAVNAIDFSADGEWLAVGARGDTPGLWNLNRLDTRRGLYLTDFGPQNYIVFVMFSPDSKFVATINDENIAKLWSISQNKLSFVDSIWSEENVEALSFSDSGKFFAVGHKNGLVKLWKTKNLTEKPIEFKGHNGEVKHLAFNPNGGLLATAGDDRSIRLWNVKSPSRKPEVIFVNTGDICVIKYTSDGGLIVAIKDESKLQLKEKKGKVFKEIFTGEFTGYVNRVAIGPNNKRLLAINNRKVQIWNLNSPLAMPVLLEGHSGEIITMQISRDGDWLATGGLDSNAMVWSLSINNLIKEACSVAGRNITPEERERFHMKPLEEEICKTLVIAE